MAIATLILGIVALIISCIPYIGMVAYLPGIAGIIVGIVGLVKKKKDKKDAKPIVGLVLASISLIIASVWIYITVSAYSFYNYMFTEFENIGNDTQEVIEQIDEYKNIVNNIN